MKTIPELYKALCPGILTVILVSCDGGKKEDIPTEPETSADSEVEVHAVAECPAGDGCFVCDASKREPGRLWCKEHHRYEDRCWVCHPELEDKARMFCGEHGVYEDECTICHPEIKTSGTGTKRSPAGEELMCGEHGVPERECAICQPDLAAGLKPGESLKIRVASAETLSMVGVEVSKPGSASVAPVVEAYCTVDYNQNQVAKITPLAGGIVRDVKVVPGQRVESGSVLGIIHSPDFAERKSQFLVASASEKLAKLKFVRERQLAEQRISAAADLETAEAAWNVARVEVATNRQRLLNLGLSEAELDLLASDGQPTSMLTLKAPFAGTIVERDVAVGEMVSPGDAIFVLADLSSMWLELSIPSGRAVGIEEGMEVTAEFDDLPGAAITGKLIWVARAIDPKTRRIQARVLIADPPPTLRKGLYGRVRIHTGAPLNSLTVPNGSIQIIADRPFVFVREEPDLYAATRVELSPASAEDGLTAVASGLGADDLIVSSGSYIMRSEFLKSLLGAGCVDD